jgi:hypothetical protein
MQKSCENGPIFSKFHEILFRKIFLFRENLKKICENFRNNENTDFHESFCYFC